MDVLMSNRWIHILTANSIRQLFSITSASTIDSIIYMLAT